MAHKVICKVDKGEGNGIEDYPIFVKQDDPVEVETTAKYYMLDTFPNWAYYGAKTITKV